MQQTNWKRNTTVFLASQAISLFGSSLVSFAITWYITLTTQSGVYMTISILCNMLPTLLLSPFAGVWADRYDRKKLIVLSDGVTALSTLVLAIVFLTGYKELWLVFAVSAIRSMGGAIQSPAVNAALPSLVPDEHLLRINGINGTIQSLLTLVSPALGGALLGIIGSIELIFFIDVVTAVAAILIMLRYLELPLPKRAASPQHTGYFAEIKQGLSYIRRQPFLMHLFGYIMVINFAVVPVAFLTPLYVVRAYGEEVWRMTANEISFSGGMLIGGLIISVWGGLKNRSHTMLISLFVLALSSAALGFGLPFWAYLAMMVIGGLSLPFSNTPAITMMQEKVDDSHRGRVFSVLSMITSTVMPLGMLIFGPLADRVPIEWLLIFTGVAVFITAAIGLTDRTMNKEGIPATKPIPD